MDTSQTIPTQKSAFLRSQIRLLSAILQPSSTWRSTSTEDPAALSSTSPPSTPTSSTSHDDSRIDVDNQEEEAGAAITKTRRDEQDIPSRTISTVLSKLNHHLATHNYAAYPPQTQRHIVEQIDALYWRHVSSAAAATTSATTIPNDLSNPEAKNNDTLVSRDIDLATIPGLDALPDRFEELFLSDPRSNHTSSQQQQQQQQQQESPHYTNMRARLTYLITEQQRQRGRLEAYRQLDSLLMPFKADQPGLDDDDEDDGANKEGEDTQQLLNAELERMKGLIAKVVARIGEVGRDEGAGAGAGAGVSHERELREPDHLSTVLDLLSA